MVTKEILELDDILGELLMLSDTFRALEIACTDGGSIVPGEAWALPCGMLESRTKAAAKKCNALFERIRELEGDEA